MERKDKETLVKVGVGALAFKWLSGEFIFLLSVGILLAIATIGILIGLAVDPAVALARFKAEHLAELPQPTPPPRKP
ncbi:hypothetical protein ACN469_29030 [Corallococcus terminator]